MVGVGGTKGEDVNRRGALGGRPGLVGVVVGVANGLACFGSLMGDIPRFPVGEVDRGGARFE